MVKRGFEHIVSIASLGVLSPSSRSRAAAVPSGSRLPHVFVMQPAADAHLRVSLILGRQSGKVVDSQGRGNNGNAQDKDRTCETAPGRQTR